MIQLRDSDLINLYRDYSCVDSLIEVIGVESAKRLSAECAQQSLLMSISDKIQVV